MSKNKVHDSFLGPIAKMKKQQQEHHANFYRGRQVKTLLDYRITAETLTNSGSLGFTEVDVSADVPDNTTSLILLVAFRDSASATSNTFMSFRRKGSLDANGLQVVKGFHINNQYCAETIDVAVDDDKKFEYSVGASGASSLDATIYIVGYIQEIG